MNAESDRPLPSEWWSIEPGGATGRASDNTSVPAHAGRFASIAALRVIRSAVTPLTNSRKRRALRPLVEIRGLFRAAKLKPIL